jgi:hypothetical protein
MNMAFLVNLLFPAQTSAGEEGVETLILSDEQKEKAGEIRLMMHHRNEVVRAMIRTEQKTMISLLRQENVDRGKLNRTVEKIARLQRQIQNNTIEEILLMKDMLDGEQCRCLLNNLNTKMNQASRRCTAACCDPSSA